MTDRIIQIKELDLLETVADDDEIAVQRKADGVVYKAEKSTLKGDKGMNWQGEWVAGTYQIDDVVEHNGSSWIAIAVTTQEPSAVASEWDLVAERGDDGSLTVATPEEINTGEDNEKGVTPQGLRDSLYPRVYRQDEEPTLADGDVWVNTGEEDLVEEALDLEAIAGDGLTVENEQLNVSSGAFDGDIGVATTFVVLRDSNDYVVVNQAGTEVHRTTNVNNAHLAIQYACDNIPVGGGAITLADGIYNISAAVEVGSNTTIVGTKSAVIVLQTTDNILWLEGTNIVIQGIYLDGNGNEGHSPSICGIRVEDSTDILISDVTVVDIGRVNIGINGGRRVTVRGCYLEGQPSAPAWYGICTWMNDVGDGITEKESYDITVVENTINLRGTGNGIGMYSVDGFTIANNFVYDAKQGIAASPARNGVIEGNRVEDFQTANEGGIEIELHTGHRVGAYTGTTHDITVANNIVRNSVWGIYTRLYFGTGASPHSIMIIGNTVTDCTIGIYAKEGDTIGVIANNLRDNGTDINSGSATNLTSANNITKT